MWIFDYFSYICIAFFLTLGLVRILRKNKRETYTEEICKKIPDKKIVILVRKINKSILFFGFLSIILAISIFIAKFVLNHLGSDNFYILIIIGVILSFLSGDLRIGNSHLGSFAFLRDDIFFDYKEENYNSISEWKRNYKHYYYFFYIMLVGKIVFYVGALGICFL